MDNSLIQTLQILLELKGKPIPGHELAMKLNPIIQVNTLEKNVHYLRQEYGDAFIPSEPVEGKSYVQYWCEPGLATLNNDFEKIGKDTRERLNGILSTCGASQDKLNLNPLSPGKSISLENKDKIEAYRRIQRGYPEGHRQMPKIEAQIKRLT